MIAGGGGARPTARLRARTASWAATAATRGGVRTGQCAGRLTAYPPPPTKRTAAPQVWVIVMSLCYILVVTVLHIIGKVG